MLEMGHSRISQELEWSKRDHSSGFRHGRAMGEPQFEGGASLGTIVRG